MHTRRIGQIMLVALTMLVLVAGCTAAPAGPKIDVQDPWARPSRAGMGAMSNMSTSAVYMTLVNKGKEGDRLVGVMSDVAEKAELHQSVKEGEVMRMQPVEGGLEIPPGGKVELKPGGYHIMLIGLKRDLKPGDRISVVLEFEKSGRITVQAEVKE